MQKLTYPQLQETLFREKLSNGLEVYLLPRPDFHKTYATFTTRYGSIDNTFQVDGKEKVRVPDGIAHFLEHKLFEQESGEDVFQQFARQGASANAFTSFTRTAYLFSCTELVDENLKTLLDFVQSPYFTEQTVEKEKGIIGQEIRMYEDNPDWRSFFGLIEALYQKHPVQVDIAGTVESIAEITKDTLYTCYETFYHPSNMLLFITGPIDVEHTLDLIRKNQNEKTFRSEPQITRYFDEEPEAVSIEKNTIHLSVQTPKCIMGFKEPKSALQKKGNEFLRQELLTQIGLEALLGSSTELYQSLYDEGLIDDSFIYDYSLDAGFGFSMLGGNTTQPDSLIERIKTELPTLVQQGVNVDDFERIRKKRIGNNLSMLNSLEWIANQFTSYQFMNSDLFEMVPTLESITVDEVNQRLQEHIQWDRFAISLVLPQEQA